MSHHLGPIAAQRDRNAQLLASATAIATQDAASGTTDVDGLPPLPVVLLPANTRDTITLPQSDREAFLAQLRHTLADVFAQPMRDNNEPMSGMAQAARDDASDTGQLSEVGPWRSALLGASCATCQGECCTAGGTHAFLRVESLVRVRAQLGSDGETASAASLEAAYASHFPERHYRDSCVFHTPSGCTLPRAMRSDLCNRYLCGSLTQLTRGLKASGHQAAYVAAADSRHLRRMSHLSASGTRRLPVTVPALSTVPAPTTAS